ncbi:MAG: hypothetical protein FWD09_00330 [Lentimicrobiaceae bacterium]|nr:hypothetical protein [Lentimicrobiaceae bacterium]
MLFQRNAYDLLSEAYDKLENAKSYYYHVKFTNLNDSIFKEATHKQLNDFQIKYETAEKQLQIEQQQTQPRTCRNKCHQR